MRHLVARDAAEKLGAVATDEWVPLAVVAAVNPGFGAAIDAAIQAWTAGRGYPAEQYADDGADDDRRVEITSAGMRIQEPMVTVALDSGGEVTSPAWMWAPRTDPPVRAQPGETVAAALTRLAGDPRPEVRRSEASHSDCPPEVLALLERDDDEAVRATAQAAIQRRNRPARHNEKEPQQ